MKSQAEVIKNNEAIRNLEELIADAQSLGDALNRLKKGQATISFPLLTEEQVEEIETAAMTSISALRGEIIRRTASAYVVIRSISGDGRTHQSWVLPVSRVAPRYVCVDEVMRSKELTYVLRMPEKGDVVSVAKKGQAWTATLELGTATIKDPDQFFSFAAMTEDDLRMTELLLHASLVTDRYGQHCELSTF